MVALTNSTGDLITNLVGEIVPNYTTTKVVKQLLSGAHHVQTIGTGARIVTAELLAQPAGRELLNKAESTGEPLRLETRTKYYVGILEASLPKPQHQQHQHFQYKPTNHFQPSENVS